MKRATLVLAMMLGYVGAANAGPWRTGDLTTYAQGDWGGTVGVDAGATLLFDEFDTVYGPAGGVVVGSPSGFAMIFTDPQAVLTYMPSIGPDAPLNGSVLNPITTASGAFGGDVMGLKFNVDFSDAGFLPGTSDLRFGDLVLTDFSTFPQLDGLTVRQTLGDVNTLLSGGSSVISISDLGTLVADLNASFSNGFPSQFAQDHLLAPNTGTGNGSEPAAPEPSALVISSILFGTCVARGYRQLRRTRRGRPDCERKNAMSFLNRRMKRISGQSRLYSPRRRLPLPPPFRRTLQFVVVLALAVPGSAAHAGLFVSGVENHGATGVVLEYNGATGAFVQTFASGGGLSKPQGLVFGPNGNLFVSSLGNDAVLEYDGTTGAFVKTFASDGGLASFIGIMFGPNGDLFVSSPVGEVEEYNGTTGAFVKNFAYGSGAGGLVFAPNGKLFVSNPDLNAVSEYDATIGVFKTFTSGGGLLHPQGLVFGPNGDLFVSNGDISSLDPANNDVLEYNGTTGAFVKIFASGGGLEFPRGLVFGPNGDLFVTSLSGAVLEYNGTTGAFVQTFTSGGGLEAPTYLTFSPAEPAVPEPSSLLLAALGALTTASAGRKRAAAFVRRAKP
jgi:hypothetical protein